MSDFDFETQNCIYEICIQQLQKKKKINLKGGAKISNNIILQQLVRDSGTDCKKKKIPPRSPTLRDRKICYPKFFLYGISPHLPKI